MVNRRKKCIALYWTIQISHAKKMKKTFHFIHNQSSRSLLYKQKTCTKHDRNYRTKQCFTWIRIVGLKLLKIAWRIKHKTLSQYDKIPLTIAPSPPHHQRKKKSLWLLKLQFKYIHHQLWRHYLIFQMSKCLTFMFYLVSMRCGNHNWIYV